MVSALRMQPMRPRRPQKGPKSGGNPLQNVATKVAKKYFGDSGAETFAMGETTGTIAPTASLSPGSTMAAAQGGAGSLGSSLHGGAQFSSGAGLANLALPVAIPFAAKALFGGGNKNIARALRTFESGGGSDVGNLKMTEEGGATFISGDSDEIEKARMSAARRGIRTTLINPNLASFENDAENTATIINDADTTEGYNAFGVGNGPFGVKNGSFA